MTTEKRIPDNSLSQSYRIEFDDTDGSYWLSVIGFTGSKKLEASTEEEAVREVKRLDQSLVGNAKDN